MQLYVDRSASFHKTPVKSSTVLMTWLFVLALIPFDCWLENVGLAVGISFLSHLQAEMKVFPVWRTPYWIFHIRLSPILVQLMLLAFLSQNSWG